MRMVCFVSLLVVAVASAEAAPPPDPVTALPVTPAAPPVPALRWKLLPELRDTTPGNAAQLYYRAFAPEWSRPLQHELETNLSIRDAAGMPPDQLKSLASDPNSRVAGIRNSAMLKEVDRAARRQYCDWDLTGRAREEGLGLLLPDAQTFRVFATLIAIRSRLELADRDFIPAIRSLQTGFALGRHVSDAPTLIQSLVGTAITGVMLDQVEEWIRTPHSPNLYWALANLPRPFIDLHKPLEGEKLLLDNLLPGFREALASRTMEPMTSGQVAALKDKLVMLADHGVPPLESVLYVAKSYPNAKLFLLSQGWPGTKVQSLPAIQVVLLAEVAQYDRLFDDTIKWYGLPYSQAWAGFQKADAALKNEGASGGSPSLSLSGLLLPAISRVVEASYRTDRRIAALRVVEAIRMHAAETGKLPSSLDEITQVPVPTDPMTGDAFRYRLDGPTATLSTAPVGTPHSRNTIKYEITLRP